MRAQYDQCRQLIGAGKCTAAIKLVSQIAASRPNDPEAHVIMGEANEHLGRHRDSADCYGRAAELMPMHVELRYRYASALRRAGDYESALVQVDKLLELKRSSITYARMRAGILGDLGRNDEAAASLQELLERRDLKSAKPSERVLLGHACAALPSGLIDPARALEEIEPFIGHPSVSKGVRATGYAQAGRLLERLKRYDDAFEAYMNGKRSNPVPWDPDDHSARVDALIEAWQDPAAVEPSPHDGSRLIFIVGMMRSGTSMTEQMLSVSERVTPGGELNAISRPLTRVDPPTKRHTRPMPIHVSRFSPSILESVRAEAMTHYDAVAPRGMVTDKQPTNFMYLPLLARLFPRCKIVHTVRDPLDTCISNLAQSFGRPQPFTHDLEHLGRYCSDYQRLMDAWHALGTPEILDLEYEKLIADPEGQSKRLFEFVGVEWTDDVLAFHESTRIVVTSSRHQVRQPIYSTSVKRHERFSPELLEPLRRGLGMV